MNQIAKIINKLGIVSILLLISLITPSCEPSPKMIGYGSNEFGQLNFEGTNWQNQRLAEGYASSWAGGNFSIALYSGPTTLSDSGLVCKGDNTFGQCQIPDSVIAFSVNNPVYYDLSLGMNHGMAWLDTSFSGNYGTNLYLWGQNEYGQATSPEISDSNKILKMAAGGNHNIIYIGNVTSVLDTIYYPGTITMAITDPQILVWGDNSYGQCDIPTRFQNLSDSIVIQDVYAGANHTIITYDSLGVLKMAAWGDNTYGQSEILTESELNGDNTLQELHCGRGHNVAVFVDYENDISEQLINGDGYIDSLFVTIYGQSYDYGPSLPSHHLVLLTAWGDNTFGQCDIPFLSGLFEDIDVGGYHNSVAITDNSMIFFDEQFYNYYGYYNYLHFASGRSIVGWGKNDQGQINFPLEYIVNWNANGSTGPGPGPGPAPANSPPILTLGDDHTLVRGSHIYRSPSIDHTFPDQFSGAMGDTLYQTITLYGIGPDTVQLDSIFILKYVYDDYGNFDSTGTHPFYVEQPESDYVLFDDSLTFQVYCIYDSSHQMNENANLFIHSNGYWTDTTMISLNSFFGPVIEVNSIPDIFLGDYGETVFKSVEFHNIGNATAYLDSIQLPDFFEYEPFGEDNYILPNDSLEIYLYITFPEYPMNHNGQGIFYFSNYNTITQNINLNAARFMKVGDNLSISNYFNYNIGHCGQDILDDEVSNLTLSALSEFTSTNVHYLDFGYFDGSDSIQYGVQLDSISNYFQNNPYFTSMIGIGYENWPPGPGNSTFSDECDYLLSQFEHRENKLIFQDGFFHQHFKEDIQSVVIDKDLNITYMDVFDQDSVVFYAEQAIDDCGLDCLADNALILGPDTLHFTVPQNSTWIDTLTISNTTEYTLDYSLAVESGNQLVSSLLFHDGSGGDEMIAPVELISSPATVSFWLKPLETNWSQGSDETYTNFLSQVDTNSGNHWEVIFDSNVEYPRIGWKDSETYSLSDTPILPTDWYHCVFVHDLPNQEMRLYVDGVEQFSHQITHDIQIGSGIGINTVGPGRYTGFLSQTSIWNTALSGSEIVALHDFGIEYNQTSNHGDYVSADYLLAYWKMDEQNGYDITDHSGNGFHAVVTGNQNIWRTELIESDEPWLNLMTGVGSQTIGAMGSEMVLLSVNSSSLNIGNYTGLVSLIPDYNPSSMSYNVIQLTIIEELETDLESVMPLDYSLHQNYPNPFNPVTDIKYDIPENAQVSIAIYDVMGRKVRSLVDKKQVAGFHHTQWDGKNDLGTPISSGMYVYMLRAGDYVGAKKMVMLK